LEYIKKMDIILKKAIKDFNNLGWRSYLIIFTIIFSLGGGLGLYYGVYVAMPMLNQYFDDVNHADFTYYLADGNWINQSQLDGLEDLEEIDSYTGRLIWITNLNLPNQRERKFISLIGLDYNKTDLKKPKVYDYTIKSGDNFDPEANNLSVVMDKTFTDINDLNIGDNVQINGLNGAEIEILGLCNTPEFGIMTNNPKYSMPLEGSMAVTYLSKDTLKNYIISYYHWYNSTTAEDLTFSILYFQKIDYNNIVITFKGNSSEGNRAVINYFDNLGVSIERAEKFEDLYAFKYIEVVLRDTKEIMNILLLLTTLLGGIIIYVIFNRYVYGQRQQIGILFGLGYTRKDIIRYFLFNVLVIAVVSIPFGIIVGYTLGYIMVDETMSEIVHLSRFELSFIFLPRVIYIGIFVGSLVIFLSTFFSIWKISKKIIAELIYEQAEVTHKIKIVKKNLISRYVLIKLVFRNLFRNKKRILFTIAAMTFSLLILSSTENLLDTMYYNVNRTFKNSKVHIKANEIWDLNVIFQTPANMSNPDNIVKSIENIDDMKESEVYTKGLVTAEGKEDQSLIIQGQNLVDTNVHYFTWHGSSNINSIPEYDDEIVISSVDALKLDKRIGDMLIIQNAWGENLTFQIVGIHADLVMTSYITFEAGKRVLHNNTNVIDGLYIILESGGDKDNLIDEIYDLGNIEVIFDIEEMNQQAMEFIDNFSIVLHVIAGYTLIISFFIVFYNSVMNIYDKNYEYGILRSLGYPKKKVFTMILSENLLQGLFPIILALFFTYPLTLEMAQVYQEEFPLITILGTTAIMVLTIPPLILYVLGSFIGLRTVYKQNLYEQVQTRFVS